jgi:hypothetical protein
MHSNPVLGLSFKSESNLILHSFNSCPCAKCGYTHSMGRLFVTRTSIIQENLHLCHLNVDEHNLPNLQILSRPQECGEPIIGGVSVYSGSQICRSCLDLRNVENRLGVSSVYSGSAEKPPIKFD